MNSSGMYIHTSSTRSCSGEDVISTVAEMEAMKMTMTMMTMTAAEAESTSAEEKEASGHAA